MDLRCFFIPALLRKCRDKLSMPQLDFNRVCQLYQPGDKTICREMKTVVEYLAIAIANLLNNNPVEQLIVTGSILKLGENFQSLLEAKINSILFTSVRNGMTTHFLQPEQEDSLACGAAIFAGQRTNRKTCEK